MALISLRAVDKFYGGQRKLVALGACIVQHPDVLLLDEPEAHLDSARPGETGGAYLELWRSGR